MARFFTKYEVFLPKLPPTGNSTAQPGPRTSNQLLELLSQLRFKSIDPIAKEC
jgi:hypothetical protein